MVSVVEFREYMDRLWERHKDIARVEVGAGLYRRLETSNMKSLAEETWDYSMRWYYGKGEEDSFPIVVNKDIGNQSYRVVFKRPYEKPAIQSEGEKDMGVIRLKDIKLNGVSFEGLKGRLVYTNEMVRVGSVSKAPTIIKLEVEDNTVTSLILYGFLQAVRSIEMDEDEDFATLKIRVEGTQEDASWNTYTGRFFVSEWSVNSHTSNKHVNAIELIASESYEVHVDEARKPKVEVKLSEMESAHVVASLIKAKRTPMKVGERELLEEAIKKLQDAMGVAGEVSGR